MLLVLPAGAMLLLAGLARAGLVTWWALAVYASGFLLHLAPVGSGSAPEVGSHALMALGLTIAGVSLGRSRAVPPDALPARPTRAS